MKSKQTQDKIVNISIGLFGEHGYNGTSIQDISKAAEISKGILYYYFDSKKALYLHCMEKCINEFIDYASNEPMYKNDSFASLVYSRPNFMSKFPIYEKFFYEMMIERPSSLKKEIQELKKPLYAMNDKLYNSVITTMNFGANVKEEDAILFFDIFKNTLPMILEQQNDLNKLQERNKAMSRVMKIFINGLEKDLD